VVVDVSELNTHALYARSQPGATVKDFGLQQIPS